MKFAVAFLAIVALAYGEVHLGHRIEAVPVNTRLFESAINKSSECIRNLLTKGDSELGLPPLDPVELNDINIDLDKYGLEQLKGQVALDNFVVQGQLGWHISKLKISPTIIPIGVKITATIGWSNVNFGGDYNLNANILDHSIEGAGAITGSATNFKLNIVAQGSLTRVSIRKLQITPSLEDVSFNVGQLVIDGNDVSESVNSKVDGVLEWVQNNLQLIFDKIAEALLDILKNKRSRDARLDNIIGAITDCIQIV